MLTVGFVQHPSSLRHVCGHVDHPERADRVASISAHLDATGLMKRTTVHTPEPAPNDVLGLAHSPELIAMLESLDASGGGQIDADTGMGPGSLEATRRATQGAVDAVERVVSGAWDAGFVCMRPPGHHATAVRPMGFCLTNHVAVAATWAIREGGLRRVAIFDWDAHHGNGTQDIFWTDGAVMYVSIHQFPWYPGSGDATERGGGDGRGATVNVPLPAGAAEDAYQRALDDVVEPAINAFDPELVVVSAGYDAHYADPLCMMRLTSGAFFRLARQVASWGRGPVCVLEGGYDLNALAWSVGATLSALLGDDTAEGLPATEIDAIPGAPEAAGWVERARMLLQR